jgi:hypothetical protein
MSDEQLEPKSFIVQNVTLGPHYVSDIRLNFAPLQAIDLTWEDPKVVKASKDLRNSLRMGLLKQISAEQFDNIEERAAIKEKKELLKQQNDSRLTKMDVDGREIEVETIDAEKAYNPDKGVSTAGYANDSLSYAMALDIAQTQAELRGDELSVEQFAEQVSKDPALVGRLIKMAKNVESNSSVSGDPKRGQAYVAMPSADPLSGTTVQKVNMTNFNRDMRDEVIRDSLDLDSLDDMPIAEAIDLEGVDEDGGEKGSVRRV